MLFTIAGIPKGERSPLGCQCPNAHESGGLIWWPVSVVRIVTALAACRVRHPSAERIDV